MPTVFEIRDKETGEILKRQGANAAEVVKNGAGRYEYVDYGRDLAAAQMFRPKLDR